MKKLLSIKSCLVFSAFSFFVTVGTVLFAQKMPLLSQLQVEPYGLTRSWFNQAEINSKSSKILHTILEGDTLFLVSNDGKLHAFDAETGKSLWTRSMGQRHLIFQEPAANSRMVAVLNALELFVYDRRNGKLLLQTPLPGAASTACEISENYVYIPMMGGRMVAFPLEDTRRPKMEEEGGVSGTLNETEENNETRQEEGGTESDPILANIVKSFTEAKDAIMAEPAPEKPETEIILRSALGIPMVCQSFGNVHVKPTLTSQIIVYGTRNRIRMHRENVTWVTDRGFLFGASIGSLSQEMFDLQFMVDSTSQTYFLGDERISKREWEHNKALVARTTSNQCVPYLYTDNRPSGSTIPSLVVAGSKNGYVFAVKDRTGEVVWQFAANGPVIEQIGVIGTDVYCPTSTGGLHNIDLITGREKWYTPDIQQFIAASKNRIYTLDRRTRLVILDRQTGNPINSFDAKRFDRFLFNTETDRIYVINETGLIQCLHERQPETLENLLEKRSTPPIRHRLSNKEYVEVLNGKELPPLYWMEGAEEEAASAETDAMSTSPRRKRTSGEDGSLDGSEMDEDDSDEEEKPKPTDDTEDDPFG